MDNVVREPDIRLVYGRQGMKVSGFEYCTIDLQGFL